MPGRNHLLQHISHLRSINFCHQTFQEVVSDGDVDGILLETHLGNFSSRVLLTLGIGAPESSIHATEIAKTGKILTYT